MQRQRSFRGESLRRCWRQLLLVALALTVSLGAPPAARPGASQAVPTEDARLEELLEGVRNHLESSPRRAIELGEEARGLLDGGAHSRAEIDLLADMSRAYAAIGDRENALACGQRALDSAEESDDSSLRGRAANAAGIVRWLLTDYDRSLEYHHEALQRFELGGDEEGAATALNSIGVVHKALGNYDLALESYQRALEVLERVEDQPRLARVLSNIAAVHRALGDTERALAYNTRAMTVLERLGDRASLATVLNNIGNTLLDVGSYRKALDYHSRALAIWTEVGDDRGIAFSKHNLGSSHAALSEYREALELFEGALAVRERVGDLRGTAMALDNIGKIQIQQGDHRQGIASLGRALALAEEIGAKELVRGYHRDLAEGYERSGDLARALEHERLYGSAGEEILDHESNRLIAVLEARYESARKEREIQILRKDAAIKDLELLRQKGRRAAFAVALVLLAGLVALLYSRYRLKDRAHREIVAKNQELARAYARLEVAARRDPLTQLSNRTDMMERITDEKTRFERTGKTFALAIADIDDFKQLNDSHGHDAGDAALLQVADLLRDTTRSHDVVGRWGGDEFILLLPETDAEGARQSAERIRARVASESLDLPDGDEQRLSMTLGVAVIESGLSIEACIKRADEALYRGKQAGKNRVT